MRSLHRLLCTSLAVACIPFASCAQPPSLPTETQARLAAASKSVLRDTGTPSAGIGIVQHGEVVYTAAFGDARIVSSGSDSIPASPELPYGIGSISKRFTAVAIMVLVEQGKLRLDAPVSTWFPELAHPREITLRNLLNHGCVQIGAAGTT